MGKFIDLTGQRFGRLTVIEWVGSCGGKSLFRCRCDCGSDCIVASTHLRSGHTQSCGCRKRDVAKMTMTRIAKNRETDGRTKTRLFGIWASMKARCHNHNNRAYPQYGGRGISVCDEWRCNFTSFRDWAMSHGYQENLSIDRIDNNGDYSPRNCRWGDRVVQQNNTRRNRNITFQGKTLTMAEWSRDVGISWHVIWNRLNRGWSVERALTEPVHRKQK